MDPINNPNSASKNEIPVNILIPYPCVHLHTPGEKKKKPKSNVVTLLIVNKYNERRSNSNI